ncbi:MAG: transcriptional activator domain protein, partial [Chloroflexi bacterium]|nr:transcriptional activator domain protein [Chloroflexota bacterium]
VGTSHIQAEGHWLVLRPAPGDEAPVSWLDANAFSRSATRALTVRKVADCCAALALYGGEYLPDDPYAEWAVPRREELSRLYLAVLLHLAGLYMDRGNARSALHSLWSILEADPCHESAARAIMRLQAASGRRAEAIRMYRRLTTALKSELDLEPDRETQALFHALRN